MVRYKACRTCHALINGSKCPNCGKTDLTDNWNGLMIVLSPDDSMVAREMEVKLPGCYAIHLR